jgi:hypothetical protein
MVKGGPIKIELIARGENLDESVQVVEGEG